MLSNRQIPLTIAVLLNLIACSSSNLIPLGQIYQGAAQNKLRNPVVLIHGLSGSRLVKKSSGQVLWGAFTGHSIDPNTREGLRALALPIWQWQAGSDPSHLAELQDDTVATGPLSKVDIDVLGVPISVNIYFTILHTLGLGGFRQAVPGLGSQSPDYGSEHYTCFTFFYDWRKDNVANAKDFGNFLERTAKYVKKQDKRFGINRGHIHFDVVAHSMGGFIARYYLRYGAHDVLGHKDPKVTWDGANRISRLLLIGTPSHGSLESLQVLLKGKKYSFLFPRFQPALMATFPSLYQLLPRMRLHPLLTQDPNTQVDIYDVKVWKKNQWGIFSPSQKPFRHMLTGSDDVRISAFVSAALRRGQAFAHAMDKKPETPCPSQMYLFASRSIATLAQASLKQKDNKLEMDFSDDTLYKPGDGTVTFKSAVGDERTQEHWAPWVVTNLPWSAIYLFDGDHLGMTNSRSFTNNLLYLLLETKPIVPKT